MPDGYVYRGDGGLAEMIQLTNGVAAQDTMLVADGFFSLQDRDAMNHSVLRDTPGGRAWAEGLGACSNSRPAPAAMPTFMTEKET